MSSGSFTRPQINWLIFFGSVSCAIHFFLSVIMTISGPAQPYIARNVGSDPATVSLQWSVRGAGWMVGSIVSSAVFKRYIRSPAWKVLIYLLIVRALNLKKGVEKW